MNIWSLKPKEGVYYTLKNGKGAYIWIGKDGLLKGPMGGLREKLVYPTSFSPSIEANESTPQEIMSFKLESL